MAVAFHWFISEQIVKPRAQYGGGLRRYHHPTHTHRAPPAELDIPQFLPDGSENPAAVLAVRPIGRRQATEEDPYCILLVTCYNEDRQGIRNTLESLAVTTYPDSRKLLFVIADGLITGADPKAAERKAAEEKARKEGRALPVSVEAEVPRQSTPEAIVSLMSQHGHFVDPAPRDYWAIADGAKQHNRAQVYAGYYHHESGGAVPMVAVVKCGTDEETKKKGNRGKRDSQMILMNFLNSVLFDDRMTPLDYDLAYKIRVITAGVTPDKYELLLMVDADTIVLTSSLEYMVQAMLNDESIMGLCGETRIANEKQSWITQIQVFEYYISHHLGKAFESVFGGVTCLPGCFCMYRIKGQRNPNARYGRGNGSGGNGADMIPILAEQDIVEQYKENVVDTLHKCNLLSLGEDRYLTTLMLKKFPKRKMIFVPHALELLGTVVLPAALTFMFVLILQAMFTGKAAVLPLLMLLFSLGLPAVLILLTSREVIFVMWMFIYLAALPVWNFILPLYAFWNFDDVTWGTRAAEGETKQENHAAKHGEYQIGAVKAKTWSEWELERLTLTQPNTPVDDLPASDVSLTSQRPQQAAFSRVEEVADSLRTEMEPPSLNRPHSLNQLNNSITSNRNQLRTLRISTSLDSLRSANRSMNHHVNRSAASIESMPSNEDLARMMAAMSPGVQPARQQPNQQHFQQSQQQQHPQAIHYDQSIGYSQSLYDMYNPAYAAYVYDQYHTFYQPGHSVSMASHHQIEASHHQIEAGPLDGMPTGVLSPLQLGQPLEAICSPIVAGSSTSVLKEPGQNAVVHEIAQIERAVLSITPSVMPMQQSLPVFACHQTKDINPSSGVSHAKPESSQQQMQVVNLSSHSSQEPISNEREVEEVGVKAVVPSELTPTAEEVSEWSTAPRQQVASVEASLPVKPDTVNDQDGNVPLNPQDANKMPTTRKPIGPRDVEKFPKPATTLSAVTHTSIFDEPSISYSIRKFKEEFGGSLNASFSNEKKMARDTTGVEMVPLPRKVSSTSELEKFPSLSREVSFMSLRNVSDIPPTPPPKSPSLHMKSTIGTVVEEGGRFAVVDPNVSAAVSFKDSHSQLVGDLAEDTTELDVTWELEPAEVRIDEPVRTLDQGGSDEDDDYPFEEEDKSPNDSDVIEVVLDIQAPPSLKKGPQTFSTWDGRKGAAPFITSTPTLSPILPIQASQTTLISAPESEYEIEDDYSDEGQTPPFKSPVSRGGTNDSFNTVMEFDDSYDEIEYEVEIVGSAPGSASSTQAPNSAASSYSRATGRNLFQWKSGHQQTSQAQVPLPPVRSNTVTGAKTPASSLSKSTGNMFARMAGGVKQSNMEPPTPPSRQGLVAPPRTVSNNVTMRQETSTQNASQRQQSASGTVSSSQSRFGSWRVAKGVVLPSTDSISSGSANWKVSMTSVTSSVFASGLPSKAEVGNSRSISGPRPMPFGKKGGS
ncbi:hypothetical protein HDU76_005293 [Blyttiomyces sp. JEL0837]|nr:hypothetical protein HDU76_005293 [Blyttiomyces sp. JEL0837]